MKHGHMKFLMILLVILVVSGCGKNQGEQFPLKAREETATPQGKDKAQTLEKVQVLLDWSPNINHTGLYVAKENGFYREEGLDVEILLPGQSGTDQMVATGNAEFGVSHQESVTLARTQGVPIVSIATIIQHNTSGFAAPKEKGIRTPKDFEGKVYGGWGSPVEKAVIQSIMETVNADVEKVEFVNAGDTDFFTAVKRDIDFFWIFYGVTGIEAELRNEPIDMIYVKDVSEKLDYYTPILITNEQMIAKKPEVVKAFMSATAKGYQFAIEHPEEAANVLLKAEPDLDRDLVITGQKWLSPHYQDDAAQWGEQKRQVWVNYAEWMYERGLLEKELDADSAFTNDFLPAK